MVNVVNVVPPTLITLPPSSWSSPREGIRCSRPSRRSRGSIFTTAYGLAHLRRSSRTFTDSHSPTSRVGHPGKLRPCGSRSLQTDSWLCRKATCQAVSFGSATSRDPDLGRTADYKVQPSRLFSSRLLSHHNSMNGLNTADSSSNCSYVSCRFSKNPGTPITSNMPLITAAQFSNIPRVLVPFGMPSATHACDQGQHRVD